MLYYEYAQPYFSSCNIFVTSLDMLPKLQNNDNDNDNKIYILP